MSGIRIEEIKKSDEWDRYVLGHRRSVYSHLFQWRWVLKDAYRCESIYLAAFKRNSGAGERLCGILPIYLFKRGWGKPELISLPFFDTAGILADDIDAQAALLGKSAGLVVRGTAAGIELRQDSLLRQGLLTGPGGVPDIYQGKVGLHLDLPGSQQDMLAGFNSKLRSQIRKGQKNGLTWKIGKRELLDPFYRVFSRNMRDLGSPVHSKRLFDAVFTHFYHQAYICLVLYRSTPVAASFMFKFKKRLSNPWASSLREFRHLNTNMFLYWQMMRFACNTGMEIFDMGRSSRGATTYRFKKQWGPKETPLYWYRWMRSGKKKSRRIETLNVEPWKRLPVTIANLIGPSIRKHISL